MSYINNKFYNIYFIKISQIYQFWFFFNLYIIGGMKNRIEMIILLLPWYLLFCMQDLNITLKFSVKCQQWTVPANYCHGNSFQTKEFLTLRTVFLMTEKFKTNKRSDEMHYLLKSNHSYYMWVESRGSSSKVEGSVCMQDVMV